MGNSQKTGDFRGYRTDAGRCRARRDQLGSMNPNSSAQRSRGRETEEIQTYLRPPTDGLRGCLTRRRAPIFSKGRRHSRDDRRGPKERAVTTSAVPRREDPGRPLAGHGGPATQAAEAQARQADTR